MKPIRTHVRYEIEHPIRQEPWTATIRVDEASAVSEYNRLLAEYGHLVKLRRTTVEVLGDGMPLKSRKPSS